jgi:hypothetical protein
VVIDPEIDLVKLGLDSDRRVGTTPYEIHPPDFPFDVGAVP